MTKLILVFLGAGLGGAARHGVNLWSLQTFGPHFPAGTFLVNVVGSFLMGLIAGWFAFRADMTGAAEIRLFLTTGVLGGFTTFSAFSLDSIVLIERGDYMSAAVYIMGSLVLSIAALAVGLAVVRSFT
ncbi:MAG: fluoride efflux transporter CrcB [Alphaproteobacteria bacterium]|jgi:CrcB protein